MYLLIVIMPLLSSILAGFFGRKVGVTGAQIIACSLIITTTILAIITFTEIEASGNPVSIYLFKWVDLESLDVYFGFNFDSLTTLMLIPVLFVSSLVHIYSIGYMSHDPHNQRFFSYLSLFTFMMIILVTANNYLLMFVGWEGVGICSYLLVSFWFTRIAANQSSIAAILTNRVGDCFLTIGMFAIIWSLGNLDYATIFSLAPFVNENIVTIIGICLLLGAMAKSSQIGLHVWLPMAMEGPTPVSALIHAATMVTAGVYLLIRSSPLIEYSATVLLLCLWIGAITSLISSLIGLFQQDIKKVIAYSTMSQLGLMVVAIGLSSYSIALFHLVNHAFYKALLFLGAGSVIHAVADKQDFRKYGGLKKYLPLSHSVMLIASLSLVAFPFMTGYFSKDSIIESCYGKYDFSTITAYYIVTIGAMFTTLYSVKTLYLTFETNPNGSLQDHKNIHEGNLYMSAPLVILALFSVYFGFITRDMFIGLGSDFFVDNSIFIHPANEITINTEFAVPTMYKLLPFILTIILIVMSFFLSEYLGKVLMWFKFTTIGYNLFSFFNLRFLIELIYNKYITEKILKSGEHTSRILDRGAIELIGPYGLENITLFLSRNLSFLDTGVVTTYAVYILIAGLTYLCIPYTYLLPISIFILLSFVFTNNIKVSSNVNIYLQNKDSVQSKLDFIYLLKKTLRVAGIAIIMLFIRNIIIDVFELHRQDIIDIIVLLNISNIIDMIMESFLPIPMTQGTNLKYNNNKSVMKKNIFFSERNDSNRSSSPDSLFSRSSEVSRPETPVETVWLVNQWEVNIVDSPLVGRTNQPVGKMIMQSIRDENNLSSTIGVPVDSTTYENNPHLVNPIVDRNGRTVGVRVRVFAGPIRALPDGGIPSPVCVQDRVWYPEPGMEYLDNPQTRSRFYSRKASESRIAMNNLLINPINATDDLLNRHTYDYCVNKARAWEAWGIHNSKDHYQAARIRSMYPHYITPPYSERYPERFNVPNTDLSGHSNVSSAVTWGQSTSNN